MPQFGRNTHFIGAMNPAIDAGDTKSDLQIMMDMGKRLRPEVWPWDTVAEFYDAQIHTRYEWGFEELQDEVVIQQDFEYRKYEKGLLRADGEPGFDTPTGLIELKSSIYPMFGEEALPYFEEPYFSPFSEEIPQEVKDEYPLVLTSGGRNIMFFHSEHRQVPSLRAMHPDPLVTINPETARAHGIEHGDWVEVSNPLGTCVQRANVSIEVDPRVVHVEHAWWFPEQEGEAPNLFGVWKSNANNLVPHEKIGRTGYGANYKSVICKISRVGGLEG